MDKRRNEWRQPRSLQKNHTTRRKENQEKSYLRTQVPSLGHNFFEFFWICNVLPPPSPQCLLQSTSRCVTLREPWDPRGRNAQRRAWAVRFKGGWQQTWNEIHQGMWRYRRKEGLFLARLRSREQEGNWKPLWGRVWAVAVLGSEAIGSSYGAQWPLDMCLYSLYFWQTLEMGSGVLVCVPVLLWAGIPHLQSLKVLHGRRRLHNWRRERW